MESTFVWASVWTSVAFSIFLVVPVVLEFFKRNLPILFGIVLTLAMMYLMAPNSPEIREAWLPLSQVPGNLVNQIYYLLSRIFS
jgi:hypothetical protein